jgi:uncharacterized protein YfaS (alpha-2-macroglobulin family)
MLRRWFLFLVCLGCSLPFLGAVTNARFELRVDEKASRILLTDLAPQVSLVVENGSREPITARIRLELLTPKETVAAATESKVEIKSGTQKLPFTLPFKTHDLTPHEEDQALWYRLRYRVIPDAPGAPPIEGLISLSEITPAFFELRIVGPGKAIPGSRFSTKVLARHPVTHRPLKGVQVKGLMTISGNGDDAVSLTSSAATDAAGYADLSFKLPSELEDDELELKIEGTLGLVTVKAEHEFDAFNEATLFVSTDKPLYQPGQTLHTRVLMLGPSKHAIADHELAFTVTDPEGTVVARSILKTSRFGIANAEWAIPESIRLGDYQLEFSTPDDDHSVDAVVKISRYDLPTFAVNVKTDRSYYLPGQNALVEINANYLFGKPVTKGHVRLVRETERSWNYREQKWETSEGDKYEGDTQADGVFKAKIDVTDDSNQLATQDYNRFTDLPYAAYFTDPSTNRTEQRRFNLRLSKHAIHIYVIRPQDTYQENAKLPLRFYVSTSYADGTPAPSSVTIQLTGVQGRQTIHHIRTNRYGLARVEQLQLPVRPETTSVYFEILARDKTGKSGTHTETFTLSDEPVIQIETSKTLFAPGDPITALVTSSEPDLRLIVNAIRNGNVLYSQPLQLSNGRGSLLIPYQREFKDEITIAAYAEHNNRDNAEELIRGTRTILFPRKRDLRLNLQTSQTYKPGEQAHVTFSTVGSEGKPVESALGVVVTDRAVDERVSADEEAGSRYCGFSSNVLSLLGYGESFAGITRRDLDQIDVSKPVASDLALVAEVILNQGREFDVTTFGGDSYKNNPATVFDTFIQKQFQPIEQALKSNYRQNKTYPKSEPNLEQILTGAALSLGALRDPWGIRYRPKFITQRQFDVLSIESAGPDKKFDTDDDFEVSRSSWNYFEQIGQTIEEVTREYHHATGKFIRTFDMLRDELLKKHIDLDTLRDPWNKPYKIGFEVNGDKFQINITSTEPGTPLPDTDFVVWLSSLDYFAENRFQIDAALDQTLKKTGSYPATETELHDALLPAGIDLKKLFDPWNRSYYFVFQSQAFYGDSVTIEARAIYNQAPQQQVRVTPVTKSARTIRIKSSGPDGQIGTPDDFELAYFAAVLSEQSANDTQPRVVSPPVSYSGSTGAITGTVLDPPGAVVPNAVVTAKTRAGERIFESKTDENGKYLIRNLLAGVYEVRVSAPGFKDAVITQVLVRSSELVQLNFTLEVGSITEVVTVTSGREVLNMTSASITELRVNGSRNLLLLAPGVAAAKQQLSTPRVREYFPETLLWQPQLTTDKKGRAQLDFKLADNITTWRMSVIGSTEDGEIGLAETDIRAFQPFFAELDPPRILTEGDQISLPVVLRNYLDRTQFVNVVLKPQEWFKILGPSQKREEVPKSESRNAIFSIQAASSVKDGKQQVTAVASDFSDAIEKPVTVHPDGEEKVETASDLFDKTTNIAVNVPTNALESSRNVELKIYPNLTTHLWESIEGIMKRPYGCGEQTISSTYPSLMVLRYLKDEESDSPIASKARKYVEAGYQRLLGYQSTSGGFTYWGRGEPDIALTAYALRFLHDLTTVTEVSATAVQNARTWLISQQREDGSWRAVDWDHKENFRASLMLTALVARSLASTEPKSQNQTKNPLVKALNYLDARGNDFHEPYLIASYSLASSQAGLADRARQANIRLKEMAHAERARTYWALETNTPFYGWGLAGRIETTALVVQALSNQNTSDQAMRDLRTRGLLFLIQNQDRYGVWYSTQATVSVLEALLSASSASPGSGNSDSIEIAVNGKLAQHVTLPADRRLMAPLYIDLSSAIVTGNNQIEFHRSASGSPVGVQLVTTYYLPWRSQAEEAHVRSTDADELRLTTRFDKNEAKVGEEITCRVTVERIGFRGFGMLLAEIGLPPGADVDRASLETAMRGSEWAINQYDVLPDRVVVYLWPRAGGSEFSFKFRPRFAMSAKASASSLYDYYNPDARVIAAPGTFVVR